MNERIREIIEQAGGFVDLNQHVGGGKGCMVYTYDGLEQFAELIIRECAFVAQNKDSTNIDLRYGRGLAAGKILEYFGY